MRGRVPLRAAARQRPARPPNQPRAARAPSSRLGARRAVNQLAKIPDDVVDDASLLRSTAIVCPLCATADGVMIQAKPLATDDKIKVILVCCGCRHKWQI